MVNFLHWLQQYLVAILGGITGLLLAINSLTHGWHSDANQATQQNREMEKYIMAQVQKDNQDLRQQNRDQHRADQELLQQTREQVALVTKENLELKEKNRLLVAENAAYHEKYGDIEYANFIKEN